VHGFIVGPTPNPFYSFLSSNILFKRNDFPVLYFPATAIIPTFSLTLFKSCYASSLTEKPIHIEYCNQ